MAVKSRLEVEIIELYRELQLLRLKYDHLADISRSLAKSWPNRGSDGRLIKVQESSTAAVNVKQKPKEECGQRVIEERDHPVASSAVYFEPSENPDIKLLEEILQKAQKIKLTDDEHTQVEKRSSKRFATESCKKAAEVYQPGARKEKFRVKSSNPPQPNRSNIRVKPSNPSSQPKRSSTKSTRTKRNPRVVHQSVPPAATETVALSAKSTVVKSHHFHSQSSECETVPSVKVVKHTVQSSDAPKRDELHRQPRLGITTSSVLPDHCHPRASSLVDSVPDYEEDGMKRFNLLQDGSRLRMPSKYSNLCSTLSKMHEHISSQLPDTRTEAMKEHFVKRLLPQDREVSIRALQLQLARDEYQLLTEELERISPREWTVSEKSEVLHMNQKLDSILKRASALERELRHSQIPDIRPAKVGGPGIHVCAVRKQKDSVRLQEEGRADVGRASQLRVSDSQGVGLVRRVPTSSCPLQQGPLSYSSRSEWLRMVELQHKQRLQRIELQLLQFCTEVLLPQFRASGERMSTSSIQMLSELAGQPKPIFVCSNRPPP